RLRARDSRSHPQDTANRAQPRSRHRFRRTARQRDAALAFVHHPRRHPRDPARNDRPGPRPALMAGEPTARTDPTAAMLAVQSYGCASPHGLGPLATALRPSAKLMTNTMNKDDR